MKVRHYEMTRAQRLFSIASIAAAISLLAMLAVRIALAVSGSWWTLPAIVAGIALADLLSGVVHWCADTWGDDDLPVIGRRLLKPFRLHHVDPDDFLRRSFIDANGDVAFAAMVPLLALLTMPLDGAVADLFVTIGFALCAVGMWTNQIHQWAHMRVPPRPIAWLQDAGLLLGRDDHAEHHGGAFDRHYCITTGWWNRPLEMVGFFRRLESAITALTGARPREDDRRYAL